MNLAGKRINISVLFDVLRIEIACGDDYEAQVVFDDIAETLEAGGGFTLTASQGTVVKSDT